MTIYAALKAKLGREPTNAEFRTEMVKSLEASLIISLDNMFGSCNPNRIETERDGEKPVERIDNYA